MDVCENAKVAQEYKNGQKCIIPIVFIHGIEESRGSYSVTARELASHGYMVFLMDHHDGTCIFTSNEDLSRNWTFDFSLKTCFEYEKMNEKTQIREKELNLLIDEITEHRFLQDTLKMTKNVRLDKRVIVAGHSMGGGTAVYIGARNPKTNCILTHDPWLYPIHKQIYAKHVTFSKQKSALLLCTEQFHKFTPESLMDHTHCMSFLRNYGSQCIYQDDIDI